MKVNRPFDGRISSISYSEDPKQFDDVFAREALPNERKTDFGVGSADE